MAGALAGSLMVFLLAVSFTDQVQLNVSQVDRLVTYTYDTGFDSILPSTAYNGSIIATWAVPDSALRGLEGRSVTVKISANAENSTAVSFPSALGSQSKTAEAYLRCDVVEGKCANSSSLSAKIAMQVSASPNSSTFENISLRSEITEELPIKGIENSANDIVGSISSFLSPNTSANSNPAQNSSPNASENFLDSLKPAGNSHDPLNFLSENPIISLASLAVVILITGAYLINSKD